MNASFAGVVSTKIVYIKNGIAHIDFIKIVYIIGIMGVPRVEIKHSYVEKSMSHGLSLEIRKMY